jgi:HEAT repeat protein
VIPAVVQSLKHSDPSMRMRAASVVSEYEMYSPGIISALSEAVDDSSPVVRRAALQTLADAGPAAIGALPQLTLMLKEPDEYLRLSAADALWRISPEQAIVVVPLLITLIDVQETRSASGQTSGGDRQALETAAVHVLGEMGPLAKDAAPVVRDLLQRGGDDLRFSAADALRHIDPASAPELVPLFVQLLASTNDLYQPEVIEVLGEIGPAAAKAVPTLIAFLNNEDDTTRLAAASALWRIDPQKADTVIPVLIQLLKREIEGEFNGSDVLETLMEMGPAALDAAPAIRALLSHPLEELRHAAAEALTKIESAPGNDRQFRSTGISAGRLHPR